MQLACQPQPIEMKRRESAESGSMLSKMPNDEQETAGDTLRLKWVASARTCRAATSRTARSRKWPGSSLGIEVSLSELQKPSALAMHFSISLETSLQAVCVLRSLAHVYD